MGGKRNEGAAVKAIWGRAFPFGRIGRALGFRWIMPIGTIPLPFHPWLARLLPWAILALIGYGLFLAVSAAQTGPLWRGMLITAGLIAVPMSIPIVSWLAMAFRAPLLQALLIGGAMALLAADAATGALPAWVGAIPAAWAGLFLLQRIGGPLYLRRLQAANAAFGRIEPGDRLVIVERDRVATSHASHLSFEYALARVAVDPDLSGRSAKLMPQTYHRLAPADRDAVAARIERLHPPGWSVAGDRIVTPGIDDPGARPPLFVRMRRHRAPLWLVGGSREILEIRDGAARHRLVGGEAAVVGPWPLFTFFYWLAIFGGRSQWVVGFAREKPESLGPARFWDLAPRAFTPIGEATAPAYADAAPLHAALDAFAAEARAEGNALLARLLALDADLPPIWPMHVGLAELASGHGAALCDCLEAAKAAKHEDAVRMAAQLLAALPAAEYRAIGPQLLAVLNSKALAFRLLDEGADLNAPEAEKRKHVIGGFRLLRTVPRLYERLGELGEPARSLVTKMGELSHWQPPLVAARETLDALRRGGRRPDN